MKSIVDLSLVEKERCACVPQVIRNKSLKPIICSYWYRILKPKNASAIEEVNSGAAGSAAMYVAIVHDGGTVWRRSMLCSHNEPYVSELLLCSFSPLPHLMTQMSIIPTHLCLET